MSSKRGKWARSPSNVSTSLPFFTQMTNTTHIIRDIRQWVQQGKSIYEIQGLAHSKYQLIMPLSLLERMAHSEVSDS